MQMRTVSLYLKRILPKQKAAAHALAHWSQCSLLVTSQSELGREVTLHYHYSFNDTEIKPKQGLIFCYLLRKSTPRNLAARGMARGPGDFLARPLLRTGHKINAATWVQGEIERCFLWKEDYSLSPTSDLSSSVHLRANQRLI